MTLNRLSADVLTLPATLLCLLGAATAQASVNLPVHVGQGTAQMIDVRPGVVGAANLPLSSSPTHITAFGDRVLFVADMGTQRGREVWISDGTPGGTTRLKNLVPQVAGVQHEKDDVGGHFAVLNGLAYFSARNPGQGIELWVTDGTAANTRPFADLNPGAGDSSPKYLARIGQQIYFAADDGTGHEPWVTDGTTTRQIVDIAPGANPAGNPLSSYPRYFAGFPGKVVFQADNGVHGRELWFTDGSAGNTIMLVDIFPGTTSGIRSHGNPEFMTAVSPGLNGDQRVVFAAKDPTELPWVTDFTPQGTFPLIQPGFNLHPSGFVRASNGAYFSAWISNNGVYGWGIYHTDGTMTGTRALFHSIGGANTEQLHPTVVGSRFLYTSSFVSIPTNVGRELVRFQPGNPFGFSVYDLDPYGASGGAPHNDIVGGFYGNGYPGDRRPFAVAGNNVFMAATVATGPMTYRFDTELWVVDNGATANAEDWGCGNVQLEASDPLIGTTMTFTGRSQIPNPANVVFLTPRSAAGPTQLPVPGVGGCMFYGSLSFVAPLTLSARNHFSDLLPIPNNPALVGGTFIAHALVFSTNPAPRLELSNPVRLVVGNL